MSKTEIYYILKFEYHEYQDTHMYNKHPYVYRCENLEDAKVRADRIKNLLSNDDVDNNDYLYRKYDINGFFTEFVGIFKITKVEEEIEW